MVIGPDSCIDEGMGSVQYHGTFNQYYFVVYISMYLLFDSCTQGMPKVAINMDMTPPVYTVGRQLSIILGLAALNKLFNVLVCMAVVMS